MEAAKSTDIFECPVCSEGYNDSDHAAMSLSCGHSCGLKCASHFSVRAEEMTEEKSNLVDKPENAVSSQCTSAGVVCVNSITCPICRNVTQVEPTSFPANHSTLSAMQSAPTIPTPIIVHECNMCKKIKRPVIKHCETCNLFLCEVHMANHLDDNEDHVLQSIAQESPVIHAEQLEIFDFLRKNTEIRESMCCEYSGLLTDANAHTISRLKNKLTKNSDFLSAVCLISIDDANEIKQALDRTSATESKSSNRLKPASSVAKPSIFARIF